MEYQLNRRRPGMKPLALSEQQCLDCAYSEKGDKKMLFGCYGGWPGACLSWTKNNKNRIAVGSDYLYKGAVGTCRTNTESGIRGMKLVTTVMVKSLEEEDMLQAVSDPDIGVLAVCISVSNTFYAYSSGRFLKMKNIKRFSHIKEPQLFMVTLI